MIRPTANLKLRRVGSHYMIVASDSNNVNMQQVFTLNETAAKIWQHICQQPATPESLAAWLARDYGIAPEVALRDINRQLNEWRAFGLIENS